MHLGDLSSGLHIFAEKPQSLWLEDVLRQNEAIKKAGSTDTEDLIAAMEGMEFMTPKGVMRFRPEGILPSRIVRRELGDFGRDHGPGRLAGTEGVEGPQDHRGGAEAAVVGERQLIRVRAPEVQSESPVLGR